MKKHFSRMCALAMAAVLLLTGCSSKTDQKETTEAATTSAAAGTEATTAQADTSAAAKPEKIVDINVMVYDRGDEYSAGNSLTDNELTRWINEQMEPQGVHVNFVPVPVSYTHLNA